MNLQKRNWAPYLLILPSFVYLFAFFGYPMVGALLLAIQRDSQILPLRAEPNPDSPAVGSLEKGTFVTTLDVVQEEAGGAAGGLLSRPKWWIKVSGETADGNQVEGWAERGNIFVQDATRSDVGKVAAEDARVYTAANDESEIVGTLALGAEVTIVGWQELESELVAGGLLNKPAQWMKITATDEDGNPIEGWVKRGPVFVEDATISRQGRVEAGEGAKEWTLDYIKRMYRHSDFQEALRTTIILLMLILPIQFIVAIIMALVLQARPRFTTFFLYVYSIPLGISDLASGLVWYSIFTQRGFMNTFLQQLGLIDKPFIFISAQHKGWIILAIVLAEVWRATSIVMVIVVSGLQAIPSSLLESGELFGASLWQRLRYIILPLLKPSLQVALILRTILAFQVFSVVIAISGGEVITVLANETYRWYDIGTYNNPHVAAAYAGFIMFVSLGVAIIYLRTIRSQEERVAT
jgi:multiple sugar transport system permease protein